MNITVYHQDFEKDLRYKHELFGNIEFCGDLWLNRILSDSTLWSMFDSLLGLFTNNEKNRAVDDNTVEAALKLINRVGYKITTNLEKAEWKSKNEVSVNSIYN